MTPDETIDLLTTAAAFDRRTVGEADVIAWQAAIGDLPFDDSRDAVIRHYQESREWIMPSDVRRIVKRIRGERLQQPLPDPPEHVDADDPQSYIAWLGEVRTAIADGTYVEPEPTRQLETRDLSGLQNTFRRVDEESDRDEIYERATARANAERRERDRPQLADWTPATVTEPGGPIPAHWRAEIQAGVDHGKKVQQERQAELDARLAGRRHNTTEERT